MPHPVLDAAARFKRQVLANEQAAAGRLTAAYTRAYARLGNNIAALEERIAAEGGAIGRGQARRLAALRSLQQQTIDEINRFSVYADTEISNAASNMILSGLRDSRALVAAHFPNGPAQRALVARFDMLPAESVETMLGFLADDSPLRAALVNRLGPLVAARMGDALVDGIATGMNPREVARLARRELGVGLTWALNTARTAQLWSYREASRANYMANSDIVGGWTWLSALDARTCTACLGKHGTRYPVDAVLNGHHSCVVDGTVINSPSISATSKRWFDGNVIEIRTVNGHILTVTENHPVLTDQGWVAARALQVGGNVISSARGQGAISIIDPNDYDRPSLIEDVLESFARTGRVSAVSVPCAAEDFHGDGRNSEIDIVRADGPLQSAGNAPFGKPMGQVPFGVADVRQQSFSAQRSSAAGDGGTRTALLGGLSNSDAPQMFGVRSLLGEELIGLNLAAPIYPSVAQAAGNYAAGYIESLGNRVFGFPGNVAECDFANRYVEPVGGIGGDFRTLDRVPGGGISEQSPRLEFVSQSLLGGSELARSVLDAFPGNVSADRIVEINVRAFSGHVYNLQTSTGWYIANGIISHNCRCTMIPTLHDSVSSRFGLSEPEIEDGEAWFNRQPEDAQRRQMGPGMFAAWKDGAFEFKGIAQTYSDPVYGDMVREASLVGLLGERAEEYYVR